MYPSKIKHVAPSILWIVFGAVGVFMTLDYMGPLPSFELGAAFWPQTILVGIILVSAFQIIFTFMLGTHSDSENVGSLTDTDTQNLNEQVGEVSSVSRSKMLAIFVLPLIYVYGMHQFGFFLVTPLFLPLYMYVMGVKEVKKLFFVSTGVYASIIFLFVNLVFTPLPQGAGFFHSLNGQFLALFQ